MVGFECDQGLGLIAVEKRVVSTMGFRQEADGRGVASKATGKEGQTRRSKKESLKNERLPPNEREFEAI